MATVLSQMIPVLPRPQPEYTLEKLGDNKPNSSVLGTEMPFALYYMNKRYSSMPKIVINTKIIIVGTSNAELGFLEQLLFGPSCVRLTFNNLTLVCPHGMTGDLDHPGLHNQLLPQTCHFSAQYMAKISLHTWVNIVSGYLTAINRYKHPRLARRRALQLSLNPLASGEV
ncbi:unnamed protein product [Timema podura]|uniref:Uncharacterized protein n=1 Tax=Timema podura TaxID=61482 RepID=A0ABN7NGD3_TIMPD|nr:unnamed protein product [Timema podura]